MAELFDGVDKTLLQQIIFNSQKHSKGATVYSQGDSCLTLDIVLSGSLIAYSLSPNGSETIVFEFKKGSIIGANLLFGHANHYPMNIYCTANCELQRIRKRDVERLLHDYHFTMHFIKSISANSQGMNQKISMYTQRSLRANILQYLHLLSIEQKSKTILLPVSKKQLADYLGVQRPSLFRELKHMKEEGLIMIDNRMIQLLDSTLKKQ
ncbi:MAG: hypothetical protein PWP24_1531 [Clostridiales bacterium]|nr:hypothetical protein [Clostridiales bacterium]